MVSVPNVSADAVSGLDHTPIGSDADSGSPHPGQEVTSGAAVLALANYLNGRPSRLTEELTATIAGLIDGNVRPRPLGFPGQRRPFNVLQQGRRFFTDYDFAVDRPAAGVTYYAAPGGTGTGATPNDRCSPPAAFAKPDAGTVDLAGGEYFRGDVLGQVQKPMNLLGPETGGPAIITGWHKPADLTWVFTGNPGVYVAILPSNARVQEVIDKRPQHLTPGNDAPRYRHFKAGPFTLGSWYQDDDGNQRDRIYIKTLDEADLTVDSSFIRVSQEGPFSNLYTLGEYRTYVGGRVEFEGGGFAAQDGGGRGAVGGAYGVLLLEGTKDHPIRIRYSALLGLYALAREWSAARHVRVSSCRADGFAQEVGDNGVVPHALWERCEGLELSPTALDLADATKTAGNNSINAFTGHNGTVAIVVEPVGFRTHGPIFAFVTGAKAWILGGQAHDSTADGEQNVGYQALGPGTEMWLDSCDASGNKYGIHAGTGATIHVHNQGPGENTNAQTITGQGAQILAY